MTKKDEGLLSFKELLPKLHDLPIDSYDIFLDEDLQLKVDGIPDELWDALCKIFADYVVLSFHVNLDRTDVAIYLAYCAN